jgi:hypothetical protein
MTIIAYNPGMQIANVASLPRGTGAKFLEVLEPHEIGLPLIAVQWRRKKPSALPPRHHLIEFRRSRQAY